MDWASFSLGLIYVYLGLLLVLVWQERFATLCRGDAECELLVASFWPITVWVALLLWWWQGQKRARGQLK